MQKKDLELALNNDVICEVSCEIESLFNNVMSTVVDYFEEALAE